MLSYLPVYYLSKLFTSLRCYVIYIERHVNEGSRLTLDALPRDLCRGRSPVRHNYYNPTKRNSPELCKRGMSFAANAAHSAECNMSNSSSTASSSGKRRCLSARTARSMAAVSAALSLWEKTSLTSPGSLSLMVWTDGGSRRRMSAYAVKADMPEALPWVDPKRWYGYGVWM